jgi:DNA-binding GntR family transcriptional regulator
MASKEYQALWIGKFRPQPLSDQVRDVLRDRTNSGEPDLGARRTETDLASKLKVGRAPLRESMNASEIRKIKSSSPFPA